MEAVSRSRARGHTLRALALASLAVVLAACTAAPRVIPIAVAAGPPPHPASRIADYPEAFQAITAVVSQELMLPIPRASLYLYPHRDAFQRGLVTELQFTPALARDSASFAWGLGGHGKILVNEVALARVPWPERLRFLAHELTHTIQYDLAGGRRGTSEQWLREGIAEWVSLRVLDGLGLDRFADRKEQRLAQVRGARDRHPFPTLSQVLTFPQWVSWRSQHGAEVTYGQALFAVDFLIERRGFPATAAYFRLFARSDDRLANFRTAFGQDRPAFEREFTEYLQRLLR
jgi:hypothetical protein